jgi:hypothetical protein
LLFETQNRLHPVDNNVEAQPDYIDKVPVPGCTLKGEMMIWLEVALYRPAEHNRQHDGTHADVKAMKASEEIKRRAVDA